MAVNLDILPVGQECRVMALNATGILRRRLLDLGFVPGAAIGVIRRAPLGDPTAYLVRGAVIALRREEACFVQCRSKEKGEE